jgi:hypothetical protein
MTDFNIDTLNPSNSYLFYRQKEEISFVDLYGALFGVTVPEGSIRNLLDYIFPTVGPVLAKYQFKDSHAEVQIQTVIQWGGTAMMANFDAAVGVSGVSLDMSVVLKANSCLGIQSACGCTGLQVSGSSTSIA